MQLEPRYIQVIPALTATGSTEHQEGILAIPSIDVGHRSFLVRDGINYQIDLTTTGEAILLSGTSSAELSTTCDRCLEPTTLMLIGDIQGYYLFDPETVEEGESFEEYEKVDVKGRIDIAPPILASIVFELPTVTLCSEECTGIVYESGLTPDESQQLDEEGTETKPSPFAALKDYRFDDQESSR